DRSIHGELLERLAAAFAGLRAGPAERDLDLGPLVSRRQQQRVWDVLSEAQSAGIRLVAQGQVVEDAPAGGFYQAPVLLADVPSGHRVEQEEIFGPVLAVTPFETEVEAI